MDLSKPLTLTIHEEDDTCLLYTSVEMLTALNIIQKIILVMIVLLENSF